MRSEAIKSIIGQGKLREKKIVRSFTALVGSEIVVRPFQILKEITVARVLDPSDYGILKFVELIQMLNKYGNLGIKPAVAREVAHAIGRGDLKAAQVLKNTGYTCEASLAFFLFVICVMTALFFDSRLVSSLMMLAALSLLAAKLRGIFNTEATIRRRFLLISKVSVITSIVASLLTILTVPYLKIYAVLGMNILASALAIFLYLRYLQLEYRWMVNKKALRQILSVGFPLILAGLGQGVFKYTERLLVIGMLGKIALGLYGFAFMVTNQFIVIFKTAIRVRTQDIYETMAKGDYQSVHRMVNKETALLLGFCILILVPTWYLIEISVPILLPNWVDAILPAQLFLVLIPVQITSLYHEKVVISAPVNKQRVRPLGWVLATGLLLISVYILKRQGQLNLVNFISVNIASYALYSFSILYLYKNYFYNPYIKSNCNQLNTTAG